MIISDEENSIIPVSNTNKQCKRLVGDHIKLQGVKNAMICAGRKEETVRGGGGMSTGYALLALMSRLTSQN